MKNIRLFFSVFLIFIISVTFQISDLSAQSQLTSLTINVDGKPFDPTTSDNISPSDFYNNYGSQSQIITFSNPDKTLSVCWTDGNNIVITELNEKFEKRQNNKITKEYAMFGGFTKDNDGNYYILFTKENKDEDFSSNIRLVKYNNKGIKLSTYNLPTDNTSGFDVMQAMDASTSRIAYGNGKIAVHMGKKQHKNKGDGLNHQSGIFFIVDAKTMKLDENSSIKNIASHSFDQRVIFDGTNFVNLDLADNYPRGIVITKAGAGSKIIFTYKTNHPNEPSPYKKNLTAGKWSNDNHTYSELGSIAFCDKGYIVTGSSEKSFDNLKAKNNLNESRNLFMLLVATDFEKQAGETFEGKSSRTIVSKNVVISKGEDSKVIQFYDFGGSANYQKRCGIVWLTNFSKLEENATRPKLAKINDNKFVALYEKWSQNTYLSTQYIVFDAQGKTLKPITDIGKIRLMRGDDVTTINNKVVWVTGNSIQKQLIINMLEIE